MEIDRWTVCYHWQETGRVGIVCLRPAERDFGTQVWSTKDDNGSAGIRTQTEPGIVP